MSEEQHPNEPLFKHLDVLRRLAVSESGFVFDPGSGHSFVLNETALVILKLMQQGRSLEEVVAELMQEYEAPPRELEKDVVDVAGAIRKQLGVT
jgi:hypothetical protein